jgi:pSer/pThr/pTyr-binding forkhead associated (FHA) protein
VGSKNGTWVNDSKLTPKEAVRLSDGDLVTLGSCDFVFHT